MFWYIIAGLVSIIIIILLIKDIINGVSAVEDYTFCIMCIIGTFLIAICFSNLCSIKAEPKTYQVVEDSAIVYTIEQYDNSTNKIVLQSENNYKFYGKTTDNNLPVSLIKTPKCTSIIQYVNTNVPPKVTRYKIKKPWHQVMFGPIGTNKYLYIFEVPQDTIKSNLN